MKNILKIFMILLIPIMISSCQLDKDEPVNEESNALSINVRATSTDSTITLQWEDVEGVSWYFIQYGIVGQNKEETDGYQDLLNKTITYKLDGLKPGKEYEIVVKGKDYLSGGKLKAISKTIKISTKNN